ncbi:hypothetical protein [Arthrobacter sp.]|uniref:hypothetical protein n=1 Tax=Arthrobacter sp. TaxID=1667 RepID=UPI003A91AAC4
MNRGPCQYPTCNDGDGNPVLTTLTICEDCRPRYWTAIRRLVIDYVQLKANFPKPISGTAAPDKRPSRPLSFGHPAEWASATAWEVAALLTEIHHNVAEHNGDPDACQTRAAEPTRVNNALEYLSTHFESLCTMPAAGDVADEINTAHNQIRSRLGQTRRVEQLPTPCPRCNLRALTRTPGDDTVECRACTHRMTHDIYLAHTRHVAGETVTTIDNERDNLIAQYDATHPGDTP